MDWAILLEHNQDGLRYAPDARLEEAVAQYRKARSDAESRGGSESLDLNLAFALLHLEKYAEVEKLADRWASSAHLEVAGRGGGGGPSAGRPRPEKAAQISHGAAERRSVLEGAAGYRAGPGVIRWRPRSCRPPRTAFPSPQTFAPG